MYSQSINSIDELFELYTKDVQPISIEANKSLNKIFLEFKKRRKLSFIDESEAVVLRKLSNGNIKEKWFVYHLLTVLEKSDIQLLKSLLDGMMGMINYGNFLRENFYHLIRIYGFVEISNELLDRFVVSNSDVEKYYLSKLQEALTIQDLISYDSQVLKVDAKGTYEWKDNRYQLSYIEGDFKEYETNLNKCLVRKHSLYIKASLDMIKDLSELNLSLLNSYRENLPSDEVCLDRMRSDLKTIKDFFHR